MMRHGTVALMYLHLKIYNRLAARSHFSLNVLSDLKVKRLVRQEPGVYCFIVQKHSAEKSP